MVLAKFGKYCMYLGSRGASCRPPYGTAKCAREYCRGKEGERCPCAALYQPGISGLHGWVSLSIMYLITAVLQLGLFALGFKCVQSELQC
jgi:hypothetical protein